MRVQRFLYYFFRYFCPTNELQVIGCYSPILHFIRLFATNFCCCSFFFFFFLFLKFTCGSDEARNKKCYMRLQLLTGCVLLSLFWLLLFEGIEFRGQTLKITKTKQFSCLWPDGHLSIYWLDRTDQFLFVFNWKIIHQRISVLDSFDRIQFVCVHNFENWNRCELQTTILHLDGIWLSSWSLLLSLLNWVTK